MYVIKLGETSTFRHVHKIAKILYYLPAQLIHLINTYLLCELINTSRI